MLADDVSSYTCHKHDTRGGRSVTPAIQFSVLVKQQVAVESEIIRYVIVVFDIRIILFLLEQFLNWPSFRVVRSYDPSHTKRGFKSRVKGKEQDVLLRTRFIQQTWQTKLK